MSDAASSTAETDLKKPISFRLLDPLAAQTFQEQAAKANLKSGQFARQLVENGLLARPSELAAMKEDLATVREEIRRLSLNFGVFASIILAESLNYEEGEINDFLASTFGAF